MKNIALIFILIFFNTLSHASATDSKKISYCGGIIKFHIPAFIQKGGIEKQSGPITCKSGVILNSLIGNKKVRVEMGQGDLGITKDSDFGDEYFSQFKSIHPQRINYSFSRQSPNGTVRVVTLYWLDSTSDLKEIEKYIYFAKLDTFYARVSYKANPQDSNDILFLNALEQLFLSAEIDW